MSFSAKIIQKMLTIDTILGGFPIEIETQISKLITYSLAIFKA